MFEVLNVALLCLYIMAFIHGVYVVIYFFLSQFLFDCNFMRFNFFVPAGSPGVS